MRLSLGSKIFFTFALLLFITFTLSAHVIRSARMVRIDGERVSTVKDFQIRLAKVTALSHDISHGESDDAEAFDRELLTFLEISKIIDSFDISRSGDLKAQADDLSTLGRHYRQAYDELFRLYREDRAFLAASAGMLSSLRSLEKSLPASSRADFLRNLNRYADLQRTIYRNRDSTAIAELKRIGVAIGEMAPEQGAEIIDHLTLSAEKNYLSSLAMGERQEFLSASEETFTELSNSIIKRIQTSSLHRQNRYSRYTWTMILLFTASTLGALLAFTLYTRRVTRSLAHSISSIRREQYDYAIPYVPHDEFGDLLHFMKGMALTMGESIEAARESKKFLQEIIDGIAEPIMVIDLDYCVHLMNRTARDTAAPPFVESGNHKCYEVSHGSSVPCDGEDHLCPLEHIAASGSTTTVQHRHLNARGEERVVELVASPFFDSRGELTGIIELGRDITERKMVEEALVKANNELEERYRDLQIVDRLKENLIRDVSHELKTPVAKHAMQLEILRPLLDKHRLSESEQQAFAVMEKGVRRQESVIRNLLDLSRLESGGRRYTFTSLRLDSLLQEVRNDYLYAIEQCGGTITCEVAAVAIRSDRDMLWHLFTNLLNNAIKFRKKSQAVRIDISAEMGDEQVVVRIADDGEGLSAEEQTMVFERFYQSTASSEGSGVGLTICKMIAEDLGGGITLKSDGKGHGSTAEVILPLAPRNN